jgi:hypothetical protein
MCGKRIDQNMKSLLVATLFFVPFALSAQTAINPIEPTALQTLQRTSDLLKKATKITFTANTTREQPATTGQLLEFFYTTHVSMVRPNLLRMDVNGDIWTASIWYDGKKITLMDPRTTFYAQQDSPPTIDETVTLLTEKLQTPLPLTVLLLSDIYKKATDGLKTGFEAGVVMVNGIKCRQLAFTEDEADWQLWVDDGPNPLPRRLSVTYKKIAGSPHVSISFSDWNLDAVIPASTFVFKVPEGATKVDVKPVR